MSRRRLERADDEAHEGGLARPRRPHDAEGFATVEVEAYLPNDRLAQSRGNIRHLLDIDPTARSGSAVVPPSPCAWATSSRMRCQAVRGPHKTAPHVDELLDRGEAPRENDRGGDHAARGHFVQDDEVRSDSEHRDLEAESHGLRNGRDAAGVIACRCQQVSAALARVRQRCARLGSMPMAATASALRTAASAAFRARVSAPLASVTFFRVVTSFNTAQPNNAMAPPGRSQPRSGWIRKMMARKTGVQGASNRGHHSGSAEKAAHRGQVSQTLGRHAAA